MSVRGDVPVPFVRIVATPDGGSRFVDDAAGLVDGDFAPPAPPLGLGPVAGARSVRFIGAPAGWDSPPHPAPARQWVVMVRGIVEATTTDGEVRRFGPERPCSSRTRAAWATGPASRATSRGSRWWSS